MGKEIIIGVIAALALTAFFGFYSSSDPVDVEYQAFIAKYKRNYLSADEYEFRRQIFKKNFEYITKFNAEGHTWWLGVNNFADMTKEEVKKFLKLTPAKVNKGKSLGTITADSPTGPNDVNIDWRDYGTKFVLPVKNQGACGSCWAFAANVGVQAAWVQYKALKYGEDINAPNLSEQLLVDCDTNCAGCMGGFMDYAYYYYTEVAPELNSDYVYTAKDEDCKASLYPSATETLLGWYDVVQFDDESLRKTLNLGPVPVAVQAENEDMYFYKGGIISGPHCGYQLDHGVGLVAEHIDDSTGMKTWTIENSWGADWGESGFARIAREDIIVQGFNVGVCGINMQNSIPTYMEYFH